ncbi:hypothetical protein BKA82DRAFT_172322 [Pisolithus tinctorius]|uniref:Uncharacterized protein n=1 Tax=Pisolithus tinctorius Marx 270 TaxID=870435 RepID=A0A0C3NAI5_PISTI|nr:hypothetical protein BKA82DRAFT_172322 [Pisolithus tinctorius]KIN92915.1 hypothetical protein M404DRAFT_172322 [Pisolithus tinctorius Marx 270]
MLRVEYNSLKKKLNAKEERAKCKGCSIRQHGLMTSAESRQRIAEEDARKAAKKQQTEAMQSCRQEKEAAVQAQRDVMDGTEIYRGSLNMKTKTELETIALVLSFPQSNIIGTKVTLLSMIRTHLKDNPNLQNNGRFSGLFPPHSCVANSESGPLVPGMFCALPYSESLTQLQLIILDASLECSMQPTSAFPPLETPSCVHPNQLAGSSSSARHHGYLHTESAYVPELVGNTAGYLAYPSTSNGANEQHQSSTSCLSSYNGSIDYLP